MPPRKMPLISLKRIGDPWDMHSAMFQLAYTLITVWAICRQPVRDCRRTIPVGNVNVRDHMASRFGLDVWAKAAQGAIPREYIEAHLNGPEGVQATSELY